MSKDIKKFKCIYCGSEIDIDINNKENEDYFERYELITDKGTVDSIYALRKCPKCNKFQDLITIQ